jgi:hypothetical protein
VSAQAPQSVQASASITNWPSPSLIAPTGHSASHAPQEMHSSEILKAIRKDLLIKLLLFYHTLQKFQDIFYNYTEKLCRKPIQNKPINTVGKRAFYQKT